MKWILFFLCILSSALSNNVERTLAASKIDRFDNSIVLANTSRSVVGLDSLIKCHLLCSNDKMCQSFFYRLSDGFCQLNTMTFSPDSNWQSSNGTRHYQITTGGCPVTNGYLYNKLLALCYKFHFTFTKWLDERQVCQDEGGDLLVLDTEEKFTYIVDFINSLKASLYKDYAVGASDATEEGDWRWVNGKELSTDDPIWADSEPNNGGWTFNEQNFAILSSLHRMSLDDDNAGRSIYFICEITTNQT